MTLRYAFFTAPAYALGTAILVLTFSHFGLPLDPGLTVGVFIGMTVGDCLGYRSAMRRRAP